MFVCLIIFKSREKGEKKVDKSEDVLDIEYKSAWSQGVLPRTKTYSL